MIKNYELILVTEETMILEDGNELSLSLAMGIITVYLEKNGIEVSLQDTNKIASNHIYTEEELNLLSNVYKKDKVLHYLYGEEDVQLDQVAEMFLKEDMLNYDSYGISIGADFSMMQMEYSVS